jgi:uncharacterized protein
MKTKEWNKKTKLMFPEYRDMIIQLREENPHFAKIFEQHELLDREICQLELDPIQQIHSDLEIKKRQKLKLKDEIYRLLKSNEKDDFV